MFANNRKIEELESRIKTLEVQNQKLMKELHKVKEFSKYYNPFVTLSLTQPTDADPDDARDMGLG